MNKDFFLRIWNIVRYFSSNESKFIYECIDKPTEKPSTCSVIATCKNETTIYLFSDIIHHVLKQQIQFQQLFQGREWWDNLNAPKHFHVTKDFLKMLNFFKHKSGFCWYRNFDNCVYLEECILCKTVKAFFFWQRNIICVASSRLTKWEGGVLYSWHLTLHDCGSVGCGTKADGVISYLQRQMPSVRFPKCFFAI